MLRFLHIIFSVDSGIKKERKTCFINHLLSEWRLKVSFVIKRNLELKSSSSSLLPGNWRNSTISSAAVSAYYKSKYTHTKLKKKKKKRITVRAMVVGVFLFYFIFLVFQRCCIRFQFYVMFNPRMPFVQSISMCKYRPLLLWTS